MEKGYTKFRCYFAKGEITADISNLNFWRNIFHDLNLIGEYENGIGYGNISIRDGKGFIISGTKTGGIERLTKEDYTKVIRCNNKKNNLTCFRQIKASAESLTHNSVYESEPNANAVIHVHNLKFWEKWKGNLPTTSEQVEYGTPEIAEEIFRLFEETDVKEKKILIMGGHTEGIISFGKDLEEAGKTLLAYFL
jgi:ribulose-5-phosphate 4-epimerase/fuculose-1-phosphate aldolase